MLYKDYIKIKKLIMIYSFYREPILLPEHNSMWEVRSLTLLDAMCELSDKKKFPKNTSLDTLLEFIRNNPDSSMLRGYMENANISYQEGSTPSINDYEMHAFILHCLRDFIYRHQQQLEGVYFNETEFKMKFQNLNEAGELTIQSGSLTIAIERQGMHPPHLFTINGHKAPNINIGELINLINYGNIVKDPSIINTQAACYFLR